MPERSTPPLHQVTIDDGTHTGLTARFEEEIARERTRLASTQPDPPNLGVTPEEDRHPQP
jgi:hypothetical protein